MLVLLPAALSVLLLISKMHIRALKLDIGALNVTECTLVSHFSRRHVQKTNDPSKNLCFNVAEVNFHILLMSHCQIAASVQFANEACWLIT